MFTRILLPLDGSALAERALPLAGRLAQACEAPVRLALVHQHVPASALPPDVAGTAAEYDQAARRAERAYLREIAARLRDSFGVAATTVLLEGPVARSLAAEVAAHGIDLVVMTTHGRGLVTRFWMGSVADELVRTLEVPVLLVRDETDADRVMPRRILVPLDGSRRSETALDYASRLARLSGGSVELVQVVPPLVPLAIGGTPMAPSLVPPTDDDLLRTSAAEYLESRAEWLRADGVEVSTRVVVDSSPARAIVETADQAGVDLVAIATHGAGGIRRVVLGSVTDKVLRASPRPLLVFRPAQEPARPAQGSATRAAVVV